MRLLYLSTDPGIPVLGHKGGSVHVREMASALVRLGAEVTIASPRIADEGARDIHPAMRMVAIPSVVPRSESTEAELRAALAHQRTAVLELGRAVRPRLVYERYALFSDAGVTTAAALGVPHVLEVNSPLRAEAERWRVLPEPGLAEALERRVFRSTGRILCVSQELARTLAAGADGKIEIVPNAVAPERFPATTRARDADAFTVGFAGSLKRWHGLETLVSACRIAFEREPRMRLEVLGDGPLMPLLAQAGMPHDRLEIVGAIDHAEAARRMARWDVGVAPYTHQEDFYFSPLKVLEYMAAGACPVASNLGQIPWLLGDGSRGVLVAADDPAALAAALVSLARDPARTRRLGGRARRYVLAQHTWEQNARVVLAAPAAEVAAA